VIVVVSGGRDVIPTEIELAALHQALFDWKCMVLRVGCADGVDAAVYKYMKSIPMCGGSGLMSSWRWWSVEKWSADWGNATGQMPGEPRVARGHRFWASAGPLRTDAMLDGDRSKVFGVDVQGCVSVGGANRLVCWPGGPGTAGAIRSATRRLIEHEPIASLKGPARL
jgi:hypothetical protein